MNSRITAILIGLLSVTGVFATTAIEQNDSITNEIVSDSITMAMPSDSITIQVTDTDSIARQQEADKNLLSLLETDSTEQILPVIKMLRILEYADSIRAMQGSGEIPVNPLFLPIVFEKQMSTPFQHLPSAEKCPFKPKSLSVDDKWLQDEIQAEKTRNLAQNYVIVNYPKLIHYNTDNLPEVPKQYVIENDPAKHILSIKYNDPKEQRILFENLVQWRLNINSAPEDTLHSVKISEDLFQINSKFGLKAYNKWYYTATMNFKTQFFTSYAANSNNKVAAFLSPAELNLGLGMSYQYKNDKKRFETSISLSPLSYNLQFIVNDDMDAASFGIKSGKSMSQYGSSFEGRIKWEFYHNMVWSCRLFYFTNYDHVQGDMENTFDFILNRFFSTRLFVHLRYDDARALNKDFGHFQLKELLSFGFNYKF